MDKSRKRVVSTLLRKDERFLILERSSRVGSYQGYWSCISSYLEEGEDPLITAFREVTEETRIEAGSLSLRSQYGPNFTETAKLVFESYWFLFDFDQSKVQIDWEHNQFAWVKPEELPKYKMVPWFDELLGRMIHS